VKTVANSPISNHPRDQESSNFDVPAAYPKRAHPSEEGRVGSKQLSAAFLVRRAATCLREFAGKGRIFKEPKARLEVRREG
jgi:hypothetical protein